LKGYSFPDPISKNPQAAKQEQAKLNVSYCSYNIPDKNVFNVPMGTFLAGRAAKA
jgi:hypothetical protein